MPYKNIKNVKIRTWIHWESFIVSENRWSNRVDRRWSNLSNRCLTVSTVFVIKPTWLHFRGCLCIRCMAVCECSVRNYVTRVMSCCYILLGLTTTTTRFLGHVIRRGGKTVHANPSVQLWNTFTHFRTQIRIQIMT